ncbi:MAG: hypothetical protein COX57_11990 [Alphaproteobacteria bacterium CG_4_10_14_0_2_um_filter_63_37]|nr:MAG: hypothetical protein AUJ55_09475 [Proteobacteria bacterium CG1_02_64_396]PJA23698.1 MAG: hypothetical protein COX57_11990 [Alphaproteobacteria bacterium CG_4_10_14_0_2_um_filter_63_37]
MRIIPALAFAALVIPTTAMAAADLVNKDSRSYNIKIHDGGTTSGSISGNTTRNSICWSCTLEVEGVGEIDITDSDSRVIIRDGQLEKE